MGRTNYTKGKLKTHQLRCNEGDFKPFDGEDIDGEADDMVDGHVFKAEIPVLLVHQVANFAVQLHGFV